MSNDLMQRSAWYQGDVVFLCYEDDGLWISMKGSNIDNDIRLLQSKGLKIEDQCHPNYYVSVNMGKTNDEQYVFTQLSLIDVIINDVGIGTKQRKSVLLSAHKLLHHHLDSP